MRILRTRFFCLAGATLFLLAASKLPGRAEGASTNRAAVVQLVTEGAQQSGARTVLQECTTLATDNSPSSNVSGAVGPANFVVVAGNKFAVYRRSSCTVLGQMTLAGLFADLMDSGETLSNPRIVYDRQSQKFAIAAFSKNQVNTHTFVYLAVSKDNTGKVWYLYRTNVCNPDSPDKWTLNGLGAGGGYWLVTGDRQPEFGSATGEMIGIHQATTVAGGVNPPVDCKNNMPTKLQPSMIVGTPPIYNIVLSIGSRLGSSVRAFHVYRKLNETCEVPHCFFHMQVDEFDYSVPAWTAPPDAPQPNTQNIDTGDGSFQSPGAQFGEQVWQVHVVDVNGEARWRLYQFDKQTGPGPFSAMATITDPAPGAHDSFNPSIAVSDTRAFVTFSQIENSNVTMMMTRGPRSSGTGWVTNVVETSAAQYQKSGAKSCNTGPGHACQWSHSSSTQLDPSNTSLAWGFNQLATGANQKNWTTRAARMR
jgi:hypothetical protein